MGVFSRLFRKETAINIADWKEALGWFGTNSKVNVTHDTALNVTTVLACVRVIAEDVAKLPMNIFTRDAEGKEKVAEDHPLQTLLTKKPNTFQTPFEFFEGVTIQAALTGWGFALRNTNAKGELVSVLPMLSGNVEVIEESQRLMFEVRDNHGRMIGRFLPGQIMVLRGPVWDHWQPLDVIQRAREAIGLATVTESTQARLHSNGARPSGILTAPTALKKEALDRLKESWEQMHGGVENSFKTAVVDSGITFQALTQTGVDSQHLETRRFQIEEVCRALKVFPQMVGHADKTSTYASAEAFFQAHFRHTMWPWLERWRQVINRDLIAQRNRFYAEFDTTNFSRASLKDRADAYRSFVELGIYTRNEIRKIEGKEPLEGLDEPLTPMNMGTP